ncbi:hypothetical protein ROZALSC1DRAFT_30351 [Rozella allomycis CSF55]|uniref:Uncharacterized protein n=1 Tax=Rozella allomycis (strain CSF55) TaxID=988480 RepID=A0A4P9YF88_ROZAC|nr:hypothetical protein ROZALSC1DRAFT_30351 [Rozella allomycis CSF55]
MCQYEDVEISLHPHSISLIKNRKIQPKLVGTNIHFPLNVSDSGMIFIPKSILSSLALERVYVDLETHFFRGQKFSIYLNNEFKLKVPGNVILLGDTVTVESDCPVSIELGSKKFTGLIYRNTNKSKLKWETLGFSLDPKYRKFFAQIIASFKPSFKDLCLELLKKST